MKGDRIATFCAADEKLQSKLKRRQEREAAAAARQARSIKEHREMTMTSSTAVLQSENYQDRDLDETPDPPAENIPCTHERKKTGAAAFSPPDILSRPNLVSLATRLKITPMQQAAFTSGLISESGGNTSVVSISEGK